MPIIKAILRGMEEENQLFVNNREKINVGNNSALIRTSTVAGSMLGILFLLSLVFPPFFGLQKVYALTFFLVCVNFFIFRKQFSRLGSLLGIYIFFAIIFVFASYLSMINSPQYMGSTVIILFCFMPVSILDKTCRMSVVITLLLITYIIGVFHFKIYRIALDDTITVGFLSTASFFTGMQIRMMFLKNFELHRMIEFQKYTDILTNVPNRRKLFDEFSEIHLHEEKNEPIGIMMLDIDFFKQYNDRYGHQAGDNCLAALGRCLQDFSEKHNILFYRYGGEEFLGITYTHSYEALARMAAELNKAVLAQKIDYTHSEFGQVTISIGFAECRHNHAETVEALVGMADVAMYRAKSCGRNCAVGYVPAYSEDFNNLHVSVRQRI